MAIINAQGQGLNPLIDALIQKEQLELRERDVKVREREQTLQEAEQQNEIQTLLAQFAQGDQFAQQFVGQTPALTGAFEDLQLSPEELMDPLVLASGAASANQGSPIAQARSAFAQRAAAQDAMGIIRKRAIELQDPSLVTNAETALSLTMAGVDSSLIDDILPPDQQALIDMQSERVRIRGMDDVRLADASATRWLINQGLLPADAPIIPGASKTFLTIAEAREEDAIDWQQEGIDFVTSRVGDSITGTSLPFVLDESGTDYRPLRPDEVASAVSVEQAINEWKGIVTQLAPEGLRDRLLEQLDSGMFARRLETERSMLMVTDILREAGATPEALGDIREILSEEFTPTEITAIISKARARAARPQR